MGIRTKKSCKRAEQTLKGFLGTITTSTQAKTERLLCSFSCLIFIMSQKLSPEKDRLYLQGRGQGQRQAPLGFPLRAPPPPSTTSSWLICPSANSVSSVSLFSTPSQFLTRQLGRNFSKSSPITLFVKSLEIWSRAPLSSRRRLQLKSRQ